MTNEEFPGRPKYFDTTGRPTFDRDSLLSSHPVLRRHGVLFPVPMHQPFRDEVSRAIVEQNFAVVGYGHFRVGKTGVLILIEQDIRKNFPKIPVFTHTAIGTEISYIDFVCLLLADAGHAAPNSGGKTTRIGNLINFLSGMGARNGSNQLAILIDEAQNLAVVHYECLLHLANRLGRAGVQLILVMVGQHRIKDISDALLSIDRGDLVSRFLLTKVPLPGFRTDEEIKEVLGMFDDPIYCDYPVRSGTCITQFYFPLAYASGWRMQSQVGFLRSAFDGKARIYQQASDNRNRYTIGMEYFWKAVVEFCTANYEEDGPKWVASQEMWDSAVAHSGFAATLGRTYIPSNEL